MLNLLTGLLGKKILPVEYGSIEDLLRPRSPIEPILNFRPRSESGKQNPTKEDIDATRQQLLDLIVSPPKTKEAAKRVKPAYRTEDAIKGGLGLLASGLLEGKEGIANFTQSYVGAKRGIADDKTREAQQKVDLENQEAMKNYLGQVDAARTKLGFMDDDFKAHQLELQRQQEKAANAQPPVDEAKLLQGAQTVSRKGGGLARDYILAQFGQGKFDETALGRLLDKVDGDEIAKRLNDRSQAIQGREAALQSLEARHGLDMMRGPLGIAGIKLPETTSIAREQLENELASLQEQKQLLVEDAKNWRAWNNISPGIQDDRLKQIANLMQQLEDQVNRLTTISKTYPQKQQKR